MDRVKAEDPKAEERLFEALKSHRKGGELVKVTRADAVAWTGMPQAQAEPALKNLVQRYRSHLAVTDSGELIYEFDPALERRDQITLGERLRAIGAFGWRAFKEIFKVWIMVTLVAYVVGFFLMMMALVLAKSSQDRDDRRGGGGMDMFWIWYLLMPDLRPAGYGGYGGGYRALPAKPKTPGKRFYVSVFDFVFGPTAPTIDPRAGDRQIISFLRSKKGRMVSSDLVALTGMSYLEADQELTRLMVEYDGEVEVAEDGTLIYVFRELLLGAGTSTPMGQLGVASATSLVTHDDWKPVWQAPLADPPMTANSAGANAAIVGFAGFNLFASFAIGPVFLQASHHAGDPLWDFFVVLFPMIFSILFFTIPVGRWIAERGRRGKRKRARVRCELLKQICEARGASISAVDLAKTAAERCKVSQAQATEILEELRADLEGDVDTSEHAGDGVHYIFPRLTEEELAVDRARNEAKDERIGQVVFSSEDAIS